MAVTSAITVSFWLAFASYYSGLPIPLNATPTVLEVKEFEGHTLGVLYAGITSRKDGTIAVAPDWQKKDKCLLAHELTHYLQFKNIGLGTAADNEPLAYRVMAICYTKLYQENDAIWALNKASFYSHFND